MRNYLPLLFFLTLFVFSSAANAQAAATFSLSPETQTVKVGDDLLVTVKFDTGGVAVKNVKALLSFPTSLLSVDTNAGIPDKPTVITKWNLRLYRNLSGTIELNGDTNVSGADQTLAVIRFKTKAVGTANVSFSQGSQIIEATGSQDILSLTDSSGGVYTLATTVAPPPAVPKQSTPSQIPKDVGSTTATSGLLALSFFSFILGIVLLKNSARNF